MTKQQVKIKIRQNSKYFRLYLPVEFSDEFKAVFQRKSPWPWPHG